LVSGYQIWLSSGLNEYLISDKRNADIISQNKEGIYSILGKKIQFYVVCHLFSEMLRNIQPFNLLSMKMQA
jgi:hypothetical protein